MKLKFPAAFNCFAAILICVAPLPLRADEKEAAADESEVEEPAEPTEPDEPDQAGQQMTPEQMQARLKEEAEKEKAQIDKMMKVFKSLEGAWTGEESLRYENDVLPAKSWKDEWEGRFTFGGRYFEMHGQTAGEDLNSAYKWICTWDAAEQRYRAWYFGDNSQNEYTGSLSQDGKFVMWSIKNLINGSQSRFSMKAEGNRVKCHGTDVLANGDLFSTQSSQYTRKRVEL